MAVMRSQMSAGRRAARNSYSGRGQGVNCLLFSLEKEARFLFFRYVLDWF